MIRRTFSTLRYSSRSYPSIVWTGTTGGDRIVPQKETEVEEKDVEEKTTEELGMYEKHKFDIENEKWMD